LRSTPRTNDTHAPRTGPEARFHARRTWREVRLSYLGLVVIDNRPGVVSDTTRKASGTTKRDAALQLLKPKCHRRSWRTVCADKLFDRRSFVTLARALGVTPRVA
jgi:hypothetical protein